MPILIARFRNGDEFLERYQPTFRYGGLFYPTRKAIELGETVLLDIRMPSLKDSMMVRGAVVWRQRGKRGSSQRAGLGIEFLATEVAKRDHLLELARGVRNPETAQRRHRRLPIELRVDWRVPNETERHVSLVDDIGAGGAFIRTRDVPEKGTPVVLELAPPGQGPQTIEARVAWTRTTPGSEGVGVEFRCRDIGGMRRLRELIRRIERFEAEAEAI
jgi:Tfp pilus assembly protein PilZ